MDEKGERIWRFLKVYSLVWLIALACSFFLINFFYIKSEWVGILWIGGTFLSCPVSIFFLMILWQGYRELKTEEYMGLSKFEIAFCLFLIIVGLVYAVCSGRDLI